MAREYMCKPITTRAEWQMLVKMTLKIYGQKEIMSMSVADFAIKTRITDQRARIILPKVRGFILASWAPEWHFNSKGVVMKD